MKLKKLLKMLDKKNINYHLYWFVIFVLSSSMFIYGISKPIQFNSYEKARVLNNISGKDLMWEFYGYSKTYPIIIGIFEIIGSISILFYRTRIFGYFLLSTILFNIILQDYIYGIIALRSAIFYQALIFIAAIYDYKKLKDVFISLFSTEKKALKVSLFISLVFAAIFKYYETRLLNLF